MSINRCEWYSMNERDIKYRAHSVAFIFSTTCWYVNLIDY